MYSAGFESACVLRLKQRVQTYPLSLVVHLEPISPSRAHRVSFPSALDHPTADLQLPSDIDAAEAQARIYGDVLSACLSEEAFDGITLWGFTDRHSW